MNVELLRYRDGPVEIVVTEQFVDISIAGSQSVGLRCPRKGFRRFVALLYKVQELSEV